MTVGEIVRATENSGLQWVCYDDWRSLPHASGVYFWAGSPVAVPAGTASDEEPPLSASMPAPSVHQDFSTCADVVLYIGKAGGKKNPSLRNRYKRLWPADYVDAQTHTDMPGSSTATGDASTRPRSSSVQIIRASRDATAVTVPRPGSAVFSPFTFAEQDSCPSSTAGPGLTGMTISSWRAGGRAKPHRDQQPPSSDDVHRAAEIGSDRLGHRRQRQGVHRMQPRREVRMPRGGDPTARRSPTAGVPSSVTDIALCRWPCSPCNDAMHGCQRE